MLAEPLAVVPAGEVEVTIEVEVVRRQLGHAQDGLLAILFDWPGAVSLLRLLHQGLLQAGNDLALRVDVLEGD